MPDKKLSEPQLQSLLEVGMALVSELDLEKLLQEVLVAARDLTGARYVAVGLLDMSKTTIDFDRFLTFGMDDTTRREIAKIPQGPALLGELIHDPKPLRLDRAADHPVFDGFPLEYPMEEPFLGVPILVGGKSFGNIYLTGKLNGGRFDEADESMLVNLAEWAQIAIGNCRLLEQSEHWRIQLERSVLSLEGNDSLASVEADEAGTQSLIESVARRARGLIECRSMLVLAPGDGAELTVSAVAGDELAEPGKTIVPDPVLLANVRRDGFVNRIEGVLFTTSEGEATTGNEALMIDLEHRGTSRGFVLGIDPLGRDHFDVDDELLLQSFAASAANLLTTMKGVELNTRKLAIEASELERRRWAMELHDETLQDLGGLKVMLESSLQRGDQEVHRDTLVRTIAHVSNAIASLESLIQELRPATLDALGVAVAVETLVERMNNRSQLNATFYPDLAFERGESASRLEPQLEATIYRVVQEALNNVAKHAEATRTSVSIIESGDEVTVVVEDNGKGFVAADGVGDRFGLHGMRERVQISNGSLEIDSAPGKGTRVEIRLPNRHAIEPEDS